MFNTCKWRIVTMLGRAVHQGLYVRALGTAEHGSIKFISQWKNMRLQVAYLPPFNEICVLYNIPLHGTKVAAQFGGPAFLCIIWEQSFAVFIEFWQDQGNSESSILSHSWCLTSRSWWMIPIVIIYTILCSISFHLYLFPTMCWCHHCLPLCTSLYNQPRVWFSTL